MLALMTKAHPDDASHLGKERCRIHQRDIETYGWYIARAPEKLAWGSKAPALYAKYSQALRHLV